MPDLKNLRAKACIINIFCHFQRNNPRTTTYLYNRLIAETGYEKWPKIHPSIRNEWDSARLNFDKMYGLIKAWYKSENDIFTEYISKPKTEIEIMKEESDIVSLETSLIKKEIEKVKTEKELCGLKENQNIYDPEIIKKQMKNVLDEFCEKAEKITLYKKEVKK